MLTGAAHRHPAPSATTAVAPLTAAEFAVLLEHLGPFGPEPRIAVGVSGGSDSLALALLLGDWAVARGGRVFALTVDHGLRREAAAEAAKVAAWLAGRPGIEHHTLRWEGPSPRSGIQAKARAIRYRLLVDWCRAHGIARLAVAHHLDDQIETHLMRQGHGSGASGLAGMSALREIDGIRLLRPLLRVPKARLQASLQARGQAWIEDPSNRDRRFERVRLREVATSLDAAAYDRLLVELGTRRRRDEDAAAVLLAAALAWDPAGYAALAPEAWRGADPAVAAAALNRVLTAIGGRAYPAEPRHIAVLLDWLAVPGPAEGRRGWTLAGCAIGRRRGRVIFARDWGAIRDRQPIGPGRSVIWDRRFRVSLDGSSGEVPGEGMAEVARLGEAGLHMIGDLGAVSLARHALPESVRKALPALWNGGKLLAVPHLGVGNSLIAKFLPVSGPTSCGFTVAYATTHTMYGHEK